MARPPDGYLLGSPPPCLHHFIGDPAEEEGIGLGEVLGRGR
jgi:hypothetical protein